MAAEYVKQANTPFAGGRLLVSLPMPTTDPEDAVRTYLTFLADPESVVDQDEVSRLRAKVDDARDPIDRLKGLAALHKAQSADGDTLEQAFVEHAKEWAALQHIPATAFQQLGVPDNVLQQAGIIIVSGRRGRGAAKAPASAARASTQRRPMVKADRLEAGILALDEPFSVRDVSEKVGGSPVTVKAAIGRLEAQHKIIPAGERSSGRGRASKLWTVAVEPL
jgi:hypothetical protein